MLARDRVDVKSMTQ